ncbi:hypothetical protein AB4Z45_03140 [Paenibacillus sp. MCAF9]
MVVCLGMEQRGCCVFGEGFGVERCNVEWMKQTCLSVTDIRALI